MGGTWDLFRYPGVRSDSDMFTFSYPFRPWDGSRAIADGDVDSSIPPTRPPKRSASTQRIRYHHRVTAASWSSASNRWTVEAPRATDDRTVRYGANFLFLCTGYYRYERGYLPGFPGAALSRGRWSTPSTGRMGSASRDQRVVIIGSGATAVTLAPALAAEAAHVTLLQRSPSYVVTCRASTLWPRSCKEFSRRRSHTGCCAGRTCCSEQPSTSCAGAGPETATRLLRAGVARQLPNGGDVDPDFSPRYRPWDQRLCVSPDGDLFAAMRSGRLTVVTDAIETFIPEGIRLASGRVLAADLIVAATGLELVPFGGIRLSVDGAQVDPGQTVIYRGFMLSGLPNLAVCVGYTNASWTFRADLTSQSVCRLLNRMDRAGHVRAVPRLDGRRSAHRPPARPHFRLCHPGGRPAPQARGAAPVAPSAELHPGPARHSVRQRGRPAVLLRRRATAVSPPPPSQPETAHPGTVEFRPSHPSYFRAGPSETQSRR